MGKILRLVKSERNQMIDAQDATKLAELTDCLDDYLNQCKDEKRRIADLDAEVRYNSCSHVVQKQILLQIVTHCQHLILSFYFGSSFDIPHN